MMLFSQFQECMAACWGTTRKQGMVGYRGQPRDRQVLNAVSQLQDHIIPYNSLLSMVIPTTYYNHKRPYINNMQNDNCCGRRGQLN